MSNLDTDTSTATGNDKDLRLWSMLCHASALCGYFVPFGNVLGPLVVWQLKKGELPGIDAHGKAALNFQISMAIYSIIAAVLCMVLIGILLLPIVLIMQLVCTIVAALKANDGVLYKYPASLKLV